MQPLIAIPCAHETHPTERSGLEQAYIQAVVQAGGTPLLIPHVSSAHRQNLLRLAQGVLLPGGIDVDPRRYGQEAKPWCGRIDPIWDALDFSLAEHARAHNLPLLAICRGVQVLNASFGGTLHQDINEEIVHPLKHMQDAPRWHVGHSVTLAEGTKLRAIAGAAAIDVNTLHHQCIQTVAPGLRAAALAPDGVIEAVESSESSFILGVQWHPEAMVAGHSHARRLFAALVEQAGEQVRGPAGLIQPAVGMAKSE